MRWRADQRKELEQLCRYITRPAITNERLKRNRAGQVVLQLKSPYKDGTTHIVMEPLEFNGDAGAPPGPPGAPIRFATVCWRPTPSCAVKSFPLRQSVPASPQPITWIWNRAISTRRWEATQTQNLGWRLAMM